MTLFRKHCFALAAALWFLPTILSSEAAASHKARNSSPMKTKGKQVISRFAGSLQREKIVKVKYHAWPLLSCSTTFCMLLLATWFPC